MKLTVYTVFAEGDNPHSPEHAIETFVADWQAVLWGRREFWSKEQNYIIRSFSLTFPATLRNIFYVVPYWFEAIVHGFWKLVRQ